MALCSVETFQQLPGTKDTLKCIITCNRAMPRFISAQFPLKHHVL